MGTDHRAAATHLRAGSLQAEAIHRAAGNLPAAAIRPTAGTLRAVILPGSGVAKRRRVEPTCSPGRG